MISSAALFAFIRGSSRSASTPRGAQQHDEVRERLQVARAPGPGRGRGCG